MKLPPANIHASAIGMVKIFGHRAAMEARDIADRLTKRHDVEGATTWMEIARTADGMQTTLKAKQLLTG